MTSQKRGATTPSEKFSARTLDGGAAHTRFIQRVFVAADDLRNSVSSSGQPLVFQVVRDSANVLRETSLSEECARQ